MNFGDVLQRAGLYPMPPEFPVSPGSEVAGTVEEVGVSVTRVQVGQRVAALVPSHGYADEGVLPASSLVSLPDAVDFPSATALLVQGMTAMGLLQSIGAVAGNRVFVSAAAGGVGGLLVQLLVERGAVVFGGVSSAAKADLVTASDARPVRYDQPG